MANPNFFYDQQIRRFLLQFARIFSNFEVEYGVDDVGNPTYVRVPVRYGDASRQAQVIMQQNSRNNVPCAPQMSFYITDLKYRRQDVQEPQFVDRRNIRQREWDEGSQSYEQSQGNAFTVERPMPVPYELSINLDIWTTNTNMKMQLMEQILPLFNPALEIQSTDNYLDWTSLSAIEIDSQKWSSRSVPNNDDSIDIATLGFKLPIWISPPARVTKEGVIHKVIANIYDNDGFYVDAISSDDLLLGTRVKITPHGYQILLIDGQLRILPRTEPVGDSSVESTLTDISDSNISWHAVIDEYGRLNDGITQIRLEPEDEDESDIIGTVAYHPADDNILLFTVDPDTLPSNTLPPVDAIVDPLSAGPGSGLPAPVTGQRYLLTDDTSGNTNAWQGPGSDFLAQKNDVIEFNGTDWNVVFSADSHPTKEFITNATTNDQFKWKADTKEWVRSYEGIYPGGRWGIVL